MEMREILTNESVSDVIAQHDLSPEQSAVLEQAQVHRVRTGRDLHPTGTHAETRVEFTDQFGYLITKRYGSIRSLPAKLGPALASDYIVANHALLQLGIRALAKNYNLNLTVDHRGQSLISVQQLFFPFGTLDDALRRGDSVAFPALRTAIREILKPILIAEAPPNSNWMVSVGLDTSLSNFLVVPPIRGAEPKVFYADFFVPRLRLPNGLVQTYPDVQLHNISEFEAQYCFLTKPGILHSFVTKALRATATGSAATRRAMLKLIAQELSGLLRKYFGGASLDDIGNMENARSPYLAMLHARHQSVVG